MRSERSPEPTMALRASALGMAPSRARGRTARAQHLHRLGAVLVLAAPVLLVTTNAGRQMRDAHGESVVLTCCPPAPDAR
jgi:hypothetical protein